MLVVFNMTAWRHITEDALRKRGLRVRDMPAAPPSPVRARTAGESVRTGRETQRTYLLITKQPQVTLPVLINILGVALQDAFPGVFSPIPTLGIHWGNEAHRVGVNVAGWAWSGDTPDDLHGWTVMPCLPRDVVDRMPKVLARIEELL